MRAGQPAGFARRPGQPPCIVARACGVTALALLRECLPADPRAGLAARGALDVMPFRALAEATDDGGARAPRIPFDAVEGRRGRSFVESNCQMLWIGS